MGSRKPIRHPECCVVFRSGNRRGVSTKVRTRRNAEIRLRGGTDSFDSGRRDHRMCGRQKCRGSSPVSAKSHGLDRALRARCTAAVRRCGRLQTECRGQTEPIVRPRHHRCHSFDGFAVHSVLAVSSSVARNPHQSKTSCRLCRSYTGSPTFSHPVLGHNAHHFRLCDVRLARPPNDSLARCGRSTSADVDVNDTSGLRYRTKSSDTASNISDVPAPMTAG